MPKLGFGIVGCGMIAGFHVRAIQEMRHAHVAAAFSRHPENARKISELAGGCPVYDDYQKFLRAPGLDVVNICTPSGAHLEPAAQAAAMGKHVVVEKPLEITLARCDRLIDACRRARVLLCTIFPSRFSPVNRTLKEAIEAGRFGRLTLGDSYVKWWRTQQYYDSGGWRGTWRLDGGGAYMNQAIHNVDLLQWFMGHVACVTGFTATLAHERIEVEDAGVAALRFCSGALGVIEAATSAFPGLLKKTEIHGTQGTVIVEQDDLLLWQFDPARRRDQAIRQRFARRVGGGGGASDPKAISHQGHRDQLADFARAIRQGGQPLVDGCEGRKSVEIILAIYQAARTGRAVALPLRADPAFVKRYNS